MRPSQMPPARFVPAAVMTFAVSVAHGQGCISPSITQQPEGGLISSGGSIVLTVDAGGTGPLFFQWRRAGEAITNGGHFSGATTSSLTITGADLADSRYYDVLISNACGAILSNRAPLRIGSTACYANCDESTNSPCLNVLDFVCVLNRYAIGDPYANCDDSTQGMPINILDFSCFLNKFAAGCSSC